MSGDDFEAAAPRLRAYLAEDRPPVTIGDLALALDCSSLAAGHAILDLQRRGLVIVQPLPGQRFRLRSTGMGISTGSHPDGNP